jgi:hypothetical protein
MGRSIETRAVANVRSLAGSVAFAAALVMAAPAATAEQLVLYGSAADDHHLDLGQEGGVGNMILWHGALEDEQGSAVGTTTGRCLQVDDKGTHICDIVLDHEGHGMINANGIQTKEPTTATHTIIGGTSDYSGIHGSMTSDPVENGARFRYQLEYELELLP